jgi:hypothetical protein
LIFVTFRSHIVMRGRFTPIDSVIVPTVLVVGRIYREVDDYSISPNSSWHLFVRFGSEIVKEPVLNPN